MHLNLESFVPLRENSRQNTEFYKAWACNVRWWGKQS